MIVTAPDRMNASFAEAFNSRKLENLLALYEEAAVLRVDGSGTDHRGLDDITAVLGRLLLAPGIMVSRNNFCVVLGDLALLRADWVLAEGAQQIATGSSAEIIRRQPDGRWLYVIDHAAGSSLPLCLE